jgi:DNA-binding MarR family transcriptional regulator
MPERSVLQKLDALLEHRSRLGICVLLSRYDALSFSRLKAVLQETDGNLGAQLRKLEDHGYLMVRKEFVDRRPVSWYRLSKKGRTAVQGHFAALEELLRGIEA